MRFLFVTFLGSLFSLNGAPALAEQPLDFDRDIKSIFEQNCYKCHGPDKHKSGLRLDEKSSAFKGGESGEPAIVPGNNLKSHLLQVIVSNDPDQVMPPKGERLKPEEIARLQKWVETGAHWIDSTKPTAIIAVNPDAKISDADRQFWSFVPPVNVEPPPVKNSRWARNRIDRFVLARLEARALTPSPDASPLALIRRLTYDLTGLPPTPEEVENFLSDQEPDAYEHLVDRLLASTRFGEHLASMWLPLARFAEDQAHQVGDDTKFFYPMAWKYREWVIEAFNRDLPYDRFIQFQIGADKLPEATPSDQAALGFLGLGPKYYNRNRLDVMADEWEDRVDTVCRTTLGLTVACARCHDHKFDPISSRDYYALAGVFASTKMVNKSGDGKVQKGELTADKLDPATLHVVEDTTPQDLNLFIRGNVDRKGPVVPRHFLSILSPGEPAPFKEGSGRKELALAITAHSNPLTARVMVNRLWGQFFGQPIVLTPSNFGHSGQPPSNQPLLDHLAVDFMDHGWSMKSIIREMVLSSAYRQTAASNSADARIDQSNDSLWRMNRKRMTVEQWRDGILFAAGRLKFDGGNSVEVDDPANTRRTVYAHVSRLKLNDLLREFDYPDANVHAEKRAVTNTPMQKLFVLNSPFMLTQAKAFAARLSVDAPQGDDARVSRAYRLLFGRAPTKEETRLAIEFLQEESPAAMSRWEQYAQILLASNEALYVD